MGWMLGRSTRNPSPGPRKLQGWSVHQLCLVLSTRVTSPALPRLVHLLKPEARLGHFSHFHSLRVGSLVLSHPHRCAVGDLLEVALLSAQLMRVGPALPQLQVLVGWDGDGNLPPPMPDLTDE